MALWTSAEELQARSHTFSLAAYRIKHSFFLAFWFGQTLAADMLSEHEL
jgi:hypothetical protein